MKDPLCFLLSPAPDGINKDLFDEALSEWKSKAKGSRYSVYSSVFRSD